MPSLFSVAPSETTKLATRFETPKLRSTACIVAGTVAFEDVVEVGVAELVDFFLAVFGAVEGHLGDQDLGIVDRRVAVETDGGGVAEVTEQRDADFAGHFGSGEA